MGSVLTVSHGAHLSGGEVVLLVGGGGQGLRHVDDHRAPLLLLVVRGGLLLLRGGRRLSSHDLRRLHLKTRNQINLLTNSLLFLEKFTTI